MHDAGACGNKGNKSPTFARSNRSIRSKDELSFGDRGLLADFEAALLMLHEADEQLYQLLLEYDPDHVYWIEIEPRGARNATYLFSKPIDVSLRLADEFFCKEKECYFNISDFGH